MQAAFASKLIPLGDGGGTSPVVIEGQPVDPGKEPSVGFVGTTPHLRRTLNIALLRGRDFSEPENRSKAAVALVNQSMATRMWGDEDPVGRRFRRADAGAEWLTVVGVVANFSHSDPSAEEPDSPGGVRSVWIRCFSKCRPDDPDHRQSGTDHECGPRGDPCVAIPSLPIFEARTMEELKALGFWQHRLFGAMFSIFGAVALMLASVGVYGMLSYSVSQRTQEIGVRMALGANRHDVLQLVVGHGLKLAGIGVVFGIAGAIGAARQIQSVLYNVTATDPVSLIGVSCFLGVTAAVASYFPARRAMAVDPLAALRRE